MRLEPAASTSQDYCFMTLNNSERMGTSFNSDILSEVNSITPAMIRLIYYLLITWKKAWKRL
jgi:hypothetical protein